MVFAGIAGEEGNLNFLKLLKSEIVTQIMPWGGAVRWEGAFSESFAVRGPGKLWAIAEDLMADGEWPSGMPDFVQMWEE